MDRIDLFRIFVRVVDSSSFTRAANTLGLPRPSVSAAIKDLEARMGARLLHRTTRKVAPTQDGLALYERCLRLLSDFEETESLFRQAAVGPAGRLRVDLPGRIGRLIVAPALAEFLDLYPEIDVDLGVTDRTVDLVEDSLDCVLRVGPLSDSGLIARSIGELALINVASPAYLARYGVPRSPEDLDGHLAVNYASPSTGRVLVVSAEATMCPIVVGAFQKIGALSDRDVPPEQASCPFSRNRDGFVLGEGAAAVILEDRDLALARGATPLVEVLGWATVSSAYHMTRIRTTGEDIAASVRQALADAELPADAVQALDAHGTSTRLNDASETAAYHDVFGDRADRLPVVAQKGVNGHALGASNLLEIAGIGRYLPAGVLPPTANTTKETLDVPLDVVLDEPRMAEPEILVKTSSGFSGIHTAAVLRRVS